MVSTEISYERSAHPVDLIEQLADSNDWAFERSATDELSLCVEGSWNAYNISLNWRDDLEALHLACAADLKVSDARLAEVYRLLAIINEQLWIGHFDLWKQEDLLLFRHSLMLNGADPTVPQCEALLHMALEACEQYFQAFQFVIWAGKTAEEALQTIMFETEGQA